jgi:hypothetical protein
VLSTFPLPITSVDGVSPDFLLLTFSNNQYNIDEVVITGFSEGIAVGTAVLILGVLAIGTGAAGFGLGIYAGLPVTFRMKASYDAAGKMDAMIEVSCQPGATK